MSSLAALQTQIAELQGKLAGNNVVPLNPISNLPYPQATLPSIPTVADIKGMVKEAIGSELADVRKLLEGLTAKPVEPSAVPKKELTILEAIGLALTEEEQLWLSKPEIIKSLPSFLATSEGMECTRLLVSELRKASGN